MALTGTGAALVSAWKTKLETKFGVPASGDATIQKFMESLVEVLIPHLVANTTVTATGTDSHGDTVTVTGNIS